MRVCGFLFSVAMSAVVLSAAPVLVFEDDFDASHTYWDGGSAALGNGWRGVLHGDVSSGIDANSSVPSCLTIQIPTGSRGDAENGAFTAPALYLSVTGNFSAIVQLHEPMPTENYDNYGIIVFDPDGSVNHATLHAFPVRATWASNVVLRITQNGSSQNAATRKPAMPWLRLERNGATLTAWCKPHATNAWLTVGSGNVAFLPAVVNIGLFAANYSSADDDSYSFERFEIWQERNPALALAPDVYRTHLFYGQTGMFTATLRNNGVDPAAWTATGVPAWLDIAPTGGVLPAGAATAVVFHLLATDLAAPQQLAAVIAFDNPGVVPTADILLGVGPETNEIVLLETSFEAAEGYNPGPVYATPGWRNWGVTNQAFVVSAKPASGTQSLKVYYTGARSYYTPGPECAFPLYSDGLSSGRVRLQCALQIGGTDALTVYPNLVGAPPAFMPGCLKFQAGNAGAMAALVFGNQTNTDLETAVPVPGGITRDTYHSVAMEYSMADQRIAWVAIDDMTQTWNDLHFLRGAFKGANATNLLAWLGFAVGYYFDNTNYFGDWLHVDDVKVVWLTDKYPALVAAPTAVDAWLELGQATTIVARLRNDGDLGTTWYCDAGTNDWLSLSPTNGYLAAGATVAITASVHASNAVFWIRRLCFTARRHRHQPLVSPAASSRRHWSARCWMIISTNRISTPCTAA